MAKEIFIVKNVSGNNIELKDFGIIIPPNDSIDLVDFEEAYFSDEIESYIINGDLVRVINGIEVDIQNAFKDNIPNFNGPVSFLHISKSSNQALTTTLDTVEYENVNQIDLNAFGYDAINHEIIFKENSRFLVLGTFTVDQVGGNARSTAIHKIQLNHQNNGYQDIPGGLVYNYSRQNSAGKESSTVVSTIDVSVGDKLKAISAKDGGNGDLVLVSAGTNLIVTNILGQPGPEGLPGKDSSIVIENNDIEFYSGQSPILNFKGYNINVTSNSNQVDIDFSFNNLNSLGLHTDSEYQIGTSYGTVSFNAIDVSIGNSIIQETPTNFKFKEEGLYLISFISTATSPTSGDLECIMVKNTTTAIPSSYKKINIYQNETHPLVSSFLLYANSDEFFNVQLKAQDGNSVLKANASLSIVRLSGIKGDKGDKGNPGTPGSGSTIVVGDGNVNNDFTIDKLIFLNDLIIQQDGSIGNISVDVSVNILKDNTIIGGTKNINFKNDNITVTQNGNNIDVEVEKPVYGTEFHYVENLSSTSTSATSPQDRLTMNLTNLPTGKYKLTISTRYNMSSTTRSALFDITLDGNTIGNQTPISIEIQDSTNVEVLNETIFLDLSGNHTIKFRNYVEGNTMTISDSRMELIRVS